MRQDYTLRNYDSENYGEALSRELAEFLRLASIGADGRTAEGKVLMEARARADELAQTIAQHNGFRNVPRTKPKRGRL